jgi:XTP/dITP diphosphohydrolase
MLERTNKKLLNAFNIWKVAGELGKPLMDMTLAEMDVFLGRGEASGKKKREEVKF